MKKFNKTLFLHHFKYKNLVTLDNVCGLISGLLIISDNILEAISINKY